MLLFYSAVLKGLIAGLRAQEALVEVKANVSTVCTCLRYVRVYEYIHSYAVGSSTRYLPCSK